MLKKELTNRFDLIDEIIANFLRMPWLPEPLKFDIYDYLTPSKDYNTIGFNVPRQTGKTTTLLNIFKQSAPDKNVLLIKKGYRLDDNLLEDFDPAFKELMVKRILPGASMIYDIDWFFPDNGKENLILLDDYTPYDFFLHATKNKWNKPFKIISLNT